MTDTDNVVKGPFPQKDKTVTQSILDAASGMGLEQVIVLGWTKTGEVYFATTTHEVAEILYLLCKVKHEVLKADDGEV